jgi:hypothetical protein
LTVWWKRRRQLSAFYRSLRTSGLNDQQQQTKTGKHSLWFHDHFPAPSHSNETGETMPTVFDKKRLRVKLAN